MIYMSFTPSPPGQPAGGPHMDDTQHNRVGGSVVHKRWQLLAVCAVSYHDVSGHHSIEKVELVLSLFVGTDLLRMVGFTPAPSDGTDALTTIGADSNGSCSSSILVVWMIGNKFLSR